MAAAAFKATLKFQTGAGRVFQVPCTVSDVNGEYYVFPDGNTSLMLPSSEGPILLIDITLAPAAGTDTSQGQIYANGKDTGEKVLNAANLYTAVSRQFQGAGVGFMPAASIRIKQVT